MSIFIVGYEKKIVTSIAFMYSPRCLPSFSVVYFAFALHLPTMADVLDVVISSPGQEENAPQANESKSLN